MPDYRVSGKTVLAEDGLHHIVRMEPSNTNERFNGWHYFFLCGDDVGYMTQGNLTDEPATCLTCITNHTSTVTKD